MKPLCIIPECGRARAAKGMCQSHYGRYARGFRGAKLIAPIPRRGDARTPAPELLAALKSAGLKPVQS